MKTIKIACDTKDKTKLETLVPLQGDLKSLPDEDYEKLKIEILETGFAFPVYVWVSPNGENKIIGGHQRVRTLKKMQDIDGINIPEIPIVKIHAKDEKEARRRILQDVSQYGQVEKKGLQQFALNSDFSTDFLAERFKLPDISLDWDSYRDQVEPTQLPPGDPDAIPEPPVEPKTKRGDIWTLGDHRLMCGDSTIIDDVQKLMGENRADMVWTDPPYNVAYKGKTTEALRIQNDEMSDETFYQFLYDAHSNMLLYTKAGGAIYVAHADLEGMNFRKAMLNSGWLLKQCLIWVKQSLVMGRQDYHWKHEPILYGWAPGASHNWYGDRKQTTVLEFSRPSRSADHPTMKPIDLIEYCLTNSCAPRGLVLDLFGGSGSTLIACEKSGRSAVLCELDPRYCDVILTRWAGYTGKDPVRDDGMKWSQLAKSASSPQTVNN